MSELLEIIVSAIDDASSVLEGIGSSAQESGSTLQTAFEEATSEVERLEQELADIELGNIEGDFDAVNAQLQQAQAEADALEQEFNEADQAASNMGDDLGIINSSMLMQLGEQVGNLGSQAEGMAQDMNTAAISVGQLATQTGIAEPQMVDLINTISNATFPNDEAMMYVKSLDQIGVSSDNLGKSATDLDRINDAFGLGAETTNSLGQELSVLGVDMNNVSSSFNALAYANSNTVGGMGAYYTFLRRYDSQFKELGLNVDQASIIIAGATQKFGGGKAALTGLNEALKESNGDTRKLEEALGLQAGALDNASAITGQYEGQLQTLADEEAEHKTILDQVGAAWEDISLKISGIASPLMGAIGLFGEIGSIGLQVKGIKELVSTFRTLKTTVMEYEAVQKLAGIATAAYGTIVGIVTGEIGLAEAATMAWNAVLAMNPIFLVIMALVALAVAVYEVGKAFGWWSSVSGMLDAIWAGLMNIYNAIMSNSTVQWVIQQLANAFNWLMGGVNAAVNAFNRFKAGQLDLPGLIMTVLSLILNGYMTILNRISRFVIQFGSRMLTLAIRAGRNFVNGVMNTLRSLPGRVYSSLLSVANRIGSAIHSWVSAATSKVQGVIRAITSPFRGISGAISGALSGVVSAITAPFQKAWDTVKPLVDKIQAGLKLVGAAGGEFAAGGETLPSTPSMSVGNAPLEINQNVTLDFQNVPQHINTAELISALSDRNVLSALTSNPDFQSMDNRVKYRLQLKQNRSRGV